MNLLILAAGRGQRIYGKINTHKSLLKVNKKALIEKIVDDANKSKIFDKIFIVVGFKKSLVKKKLKNKKKINFIYNKKYKSTEMTQSLLLGLKKLDGDTVVCYSDIYFSKKIFEKIEKNKINKKVLLPVTTNWKKVWKLRKKNYKDDCETLKINNKNILIEIGNKIKNYKDVHAQYMGIFFLSKKTKKFFQELLSKKSKKRKIHITYFLNSIKKKISIYCLRTKDYWYEFDDYDDYLNFKNK